MAIAAAYNLNEIIDGGVPSAPLLNAIGTGNLIVLQDGNAETCTIEAGDLARWLTEQWCEPWAASASAELFDGGEH
jgi:hypothetical protein